MSYSQIFDISAAGMALERLRLDTVANNLANRHSLSTVNGKPYQAVHVVATAAPLFTQELDASQGLKFKGGIANTHLVTDNRPPNMVYDPSNPYANAKGFVAYPNVNTVDEMTTLITATRAYEANVKVINAAKTMALNALQIGEKQ